MTAGDQGGRARVVVATSAYARCSREPSGAVGIDYYTEPLPTLLGVELGEYLRSRDGLGLAAALDAVLRQLSVDATEASVALSLVDPTGRGRDLLAEVEGLRAGQVPNATLTVHELQPSRSASLPETAAASGGTGIVMVSAGDDGPRVDFIDETACRLAAVAATAFAGTPAAAVLLARSVAVLGMVDLPSDSPLLRLTLADGHWHGRTLVCALHPGVDAAGNARVAVRITERREEDTRSEPDWRHTDSLLRLLRLSEVLLEHPPQRAGLARIAEEIAGAPGLREAVIARADGHPRCLQVSAHGRRAGSSVQARVWLSTNGAAIATAIAERRMAVERGEAPDATWLYLPIEVADDLEGVLAIAADTDLAIDGWQEEILSSYADYVAAFIAGLPARPRALQSPTPRARDEVDIDAQLTSRQQDVLFDLVEHGASNRDIARSLATTEATVKVHMRAILAALHVSNRAEAVQVVYRRASGWLARRQRQQGRPAADRRRRGSDD